MTNQTLNAKTWTKLGLIVTAWGGLITYLTVAGIFNVAPTAPNTPILLAILTPPLLGVVAYLALPSFRDWVLALDPMLLISLHSWRMLGGVFVFLYFYDMLPAAFAFPAGLGDMAVGAVAPFVALALLHQKDFMRSRRFWAFHFFGLLDFVIAVSVGTMTRVEIPGLVEGATSVATGQFPLALIPAFIVPALILVHFASIAQGLNQVAPVTAHQPRAA